MTAMQLALLVCVSWTVSTRALSQFLTLPPNPVDHPLIFPTPPPQYHNQRLKLVTIYNEKLFKGSSLELKVDKCESLKDDSRFDRRVSSVNTHGKCVNMYRSTDCSGTFIRIEPGTPHKDMRNWPGYRESIRSVGPCLDECHSSNIERLNRTDNDTYVDVTLYEGVNRNGKMAEVRLRYNQCLPIPESLGESVGSLTTSTDACVQIYNGPDCTNEDEVLPTSVPCMRNRLWDLWVNGGTYSISLCGYNCLEGRKPYSQSQTNKISDVPCRHCRTENTIEYDYLHLDEELANVGVTENPDDIVSTTIQPPRTSRRYSHTRGIKLELPSSFSLTNNDDSSLEMCVD